MTKKKFIILAFFLQAIVVTVTGQEKNNNFKFFYFNEQNKPVYTERVILNTDRDLYLTGETIWFKVYCVESSTNKLNSFSKVLYIELFDHQAKLLSNKKVELENGMASGNLHLPEDALSGNYCIRAYTKYMRNFDKDFFSVARIKVVNPEKKIKAIVADSVSTVADVRFYAESGVFLSGIKNKLVVKALDNTGQPVAKVQGQVIDEKNTVICSFVTNKSGLARIFLNPEYEKEYEAVIFVNDSTKEYFSLPEVSKTGVAILISENTTNSLQIILLSNSETQTSDKEYTLKLFYNGIVYYTTKRKLGSLNLETIQLQTNKLPYGENIAYLYNDSTKLVAQRSFFISKGKHVQISAKTDKKVYRCREKVKIELALESDFKESCLANLSLAVTKKGMHPQNDNIAICENQVSEYASQMIDDTYITKSPKQMSIVKNIDYLPENKGISISGTLINSLNEKPMKNTEVYLAHLGGKFQTYNTLSDKNGRFNFLLDSRFHITEMLLKPKNENDESLSILIDSDFELQKPAIQSSNIILTPEIRELLKKAFISKQINKVYKTGSCNVPEKTAPNYHFYGETEQSYLLSDYIPLPTLEEVFFELIPSVSVIKFNDEKIIRCNERMSLNIEPLILIDGVPVFNHAKILSIHPSKLLSINVTPTRYIHGDSYYGGVISLTTKDNNLAVVKLPKSTLFFDYADFIRSNNFVAPQYNETNDKKHHADYRNLLYWNPNIRTNSTKATNIEFYLSDEPGEYVVTINGISEDGQTLLKTFSIRVKL